MEQSTPSATDIHASATYATVIRGLEERHPEAWAILKEEAANPTNDFVKLGLHSSGLHILINHFQEAGNFVFIDCRISSEEVQKTAWFRASTAPKRSPGILYVCFYSKSFLEELVAKEIEEARNTMLRDLVLHYQGQDEHVLRAHGILKPLFNRQGYDLVKRVIHSSGSSTTSSFGFGARSPGGEYYEILCPSQSERNTLRLV